QVVEMRTTIQDGLPQHQVAHVQVRYGRLGRERGAQPQPDHRYPTYAGLVAQLIRRLEDIVDPLRRAGLGNVARRITGPVIIEAQDVKAFLVEQTGQLAEGKVRTHVLLDGWVAQEYAVLSVTTPDRRVIHAKQTPLGGSKVHWQ